MAAAGVNWVVGQTYSESPARWLEAVQLCLELGGDVNAVNAMGLAAVHGAANRGSDDIIELLATHGARLDVADKEGPHADRRGREGVFLATNSPVAKPSTMALLKRLLTARIAGNGRALTMKHRCCRCASSFASSPAVTATGVEPDARAAGRAPAAAARRGVR